MARVIVVAVLVLLGMAPATASGAFNFARVDVFTADGNGLPATQAGSHPFALTTTLQMGTLEASGEEVPDGNLRHLRVDYPAGLVAATFATPRCVAADFVQIEGNRNECSNDTAVGVAELKVAADPLPADSPDFPDRVPIYNLVPSPGAAGSVGFVVAGRPVIAELGIGDAPPYRGFLALSDFPQDLLFYGARITLWGVPAAIAHDSERGQCVFVIGGCPVGVDPVAYLTLPRSCSGPLATSFAATAWGAPAQTTTAMSMSHDGGEPPLPLGLGGCDDLVFWPAIGAGLTTDLAATPTGLELSIEVDDAGIYSPAGTSDSEVKRVEMVLPEGTAINPAALAGVVCTPVQLAQEGIDSEPGEGCPLEAEIGTVEARSALLWGEDFAGRVFIAEPGDAAATLYAVLRHPETGILVKESGEVAAGAGGQLAVVFDELPQIPVTDLGLSLHGGARAPLLTPPDCGEFRLEAVLSPWAEPDAAYVATAPVEIVHGRGGGPCSPEPSVEPDAGEPAPGQHPASTAPLGLVAKPHVKKRRCHKGKRRPAARSKARCGKKRCAQWRCRGARRSHPRPAG